MDAGLLLQYLIIAVAVVLSVWVVAKKQFPGSVRKLRVSLALFLLRDGRPEWMRSLGRGLAPPGTAGDGSCGGCNGCG